MKSLFETKAIIKFYANKFESVFWIDAHSFLAFFILKIININL